MPMDRWQAMRVFVRVADAGGFADAARQLNLSPPAVTRIIAALEDIVGTRLLTRTTRSVKLTEAGRRYAEDCKRILADISEAEASAAGSHAMPAGTLVVTASVLFGRIYVLPILTEYLDTYPAMTTRAVFVDRIVNIVEEGIDVAVRIGHLPDSGMSAARVGSVRRVVCGAPAYFRRRGTPQVPGDLARHDIIGSTGAWSSSEWRFGQAQKTRVDVHPRLFCNTNDAAIDAAIGGWGVARILAYQVAPALANGRLSVVLPDFEEDPLPIHIVHPEGRRAPAKVRTFVDLAVARLRANDMINPPVAGSA
jgi:DNA-binding transcriptional LysR family regulator